MAGSFAGKGTGKSIAEKRLKMTGEIRYKSNDEHPDVETKITEMLKKKRKIFLTVTEIRNNLPATLLKHIGLLKKTAPTTEVLKKLRPYLGNMWEYKGPRSTYIGYSMSPEDIIENEIKRNPGISPKILAKNMPMKKKDFVSGLNKLLETGAIACTFNELLTPCLKICAKVGAQISLEERPVNGRVAFKDAYNRIGKGRGFVRIHRIREDLNWSRERFDHILLDLMSDYTIELHGGDPTTLSEQEITDSFTDENGLLYINVTWWGE